MPGNDGLSEFLQALDAVAATRREVAPGVVAVLELGNGMSVALARPDALREQDVNARLMTPTMMKQFEANVARRGMLESLPYCVLVTRGGKAVVEVVSGHHRKRVASTVGLASIAILLDESGLSRSQIAAKQLAHNAIAGFDDSATLRAIGALIDNVDDLLETTLAETLGSPLALPDGAVGDLFQPRLRYDWQTLTFSFLPAHMQAFDAVVNATLESKPDSVAVVPAEQFAQFSRALTGFARAFDIHNTSAALATLIELAERELEQAGAIEAVDDDERAEKWEPLARVVGHASVPEGAAKVIRAALDRMQRAGEVGPHNRWQGLEWLCAAYLAEPEERAEAEATATPAQLSRWRGMESEYD